MEVDRVSEEELSYWLAFESLKGTGLGTQKVLLLYDRFQSIKDAWESSKGDLVTIAHMQADAAEAFVKNRRDVNRDELLSRAQPNCVRCISFTDSAYPYQLRQIHDPPLVLFIRGEMAAYDFNNIVGIVGTRSPSQYGQKLAKEFAKNLAENGAVLASGLAVGIDSYAHWGAIEGGGRTLAIVATGPDICYPSSNRRLYENIIDGHGLIVSEYFPGTTPEKWHFPARNRIISGLSKAILVVEAGEQSGALITAKIAFHQNREVFAIPGRIDSPMSQGTNDLIRRHMAQLVSTPKDVLDSLQWVKTNVNKVTTVVELYGREKDIYEMLSTEPSHFDVLCQQSGMAPGEMSSTLTMLELAGLVERHAGDWYSRHEFQSANFNASSLPTF